MLPGFDEDYYKAMFGNAPLCEMCEKNEADEYGICLDCREIMLDNVEALEEYIADEDTQYRDFVVWYMDDTEHRGTPFTDLEQLIQEHKGTLEYNEGMREYVENDVKYYIDWYLIWRNR